MQFFGDKVAARLQQASTLDASVYTSSEIFDSEFSKFFPNTWQYFCAEGELAAEPGANLSRVILGVPVLVFRDDAHELRAFVNVCKHRGGPLVPIRGAKTIQCRYHGWTYRKDGALAVAPYMQEAEGFDKTCVHLTKVRIESWQGMVFVSLAPNKTSLQEFFSGVSERVVAAGQSFDNLKFYNTKSYEINCNWKIYCDNYLEGYHVPYLHPTLVSALDFASYVTTTHERYSLQVSPLAPGNQSPYQGNEALYFFFMPNLMFNMLPGRLQVNVVVPLAVDRCRVDFHYFYDDIGASAVEGFIRSEQEFADKVQDEDIEICEHLQVAMQSGHYNAGRYSPEFENALHHFHLYWQSEVG